MVRDTLLDNLCWPHGRCVPKKTYSDFNHPQNSWDWVIIWPASPGVPRATECLAEVDQCPFSFFLGSDGRRSPRRVRVSVHIMITSLQRVWSVADVSTDVRATLGSFSCLSAEPFVGTLVGGGGVGWRGALASTSRSAKASSPMTALFYSACCRSVLVYRVTLYTSWALRGAYKCDQYSCMYLCRY